jgi:AmiR/NasT family two-component response regulator
MVPGSRASCADDGANCAEARAEQLQQALNTRLIIEQAKGVLAAKRETTVDDAFQTLRKYAREHNARIHDVCRAVVRGELLL